MKKFLIFVLCGTFLYVVVSIGLSFLNLSRDWNVIISAVSIGLIQGYIGFLMDVRFVLSIESVPR